MKMVNPFCVKQAVYKHISVWYVYGLQFSQDLFTSFVASINSCFLF